MQDFETLRHAEHQIQRTSFFHCLLSCGVMRIGCPWEHGNTVKVKGTNHWLINYFSSTNFTFKPFDKVSNIIHHLPKVIS